MPTVMFLPGKREQRSGEVDRTCERWRTTWKSGLFIELGRYFREYPIGGIKLTSATCSCSHHLSTYGEKVCCLRFRLLVCVHIIEQYRTQLLTPLQQKAAEYGNEEFCAYLISKGSNLNHVNKLGQTPLHIAVTHSRDTVAKLLLDKVLLLESYLIMLTTNRNL